MAWLRPRIRRWLYADVKTPKMDIAELRRVGAVWREVGRETREREFEEFLSRREQVKGHAD